MDQESIGKLTFLIAYNSLPVISAGLEQVYQNHRPTWTHRWRGYPRFFDSTSSSEDGAYHDSSYLTPEIPKEIDDGTCCWQVDLRHLAQTEDSNRIDVGIDLTDYYISVEWDIIKVPAVRNEAFYICCEEPYPDIVFNITLRRKTLFYTVNLIVPCVGISFLSLLVFYLPSDSGEKVSLSISILLSLTVFFLLLAEIIPPTSLTVPLLGKYLLFTMVLVTLSVVVTIAVLNVNFRSPVTHRMAKWVRVVFIQVLPRFLLIERPKKDDDDEEEEEMVVGRNGVGVVGVTADGEPIDEDDDDDDDDDDVEATNGKPPEGMLTDVFHVQETDKYDTYYGNRFSGEYEIPAHGLPPSATSPTFEKPLVREIEKTVDDARFIAQHAKNKDKFESRHYNLTHKVFINEEFVTLYDLSNFNFKKLEILINNEMYSALNDMKTTGRKFPFDRKYSKILKALRMKAMIKSKRISRKKKFLKTVSE
ncbi:Acetylcholine receptor subunit alpha-like 1 [Melipona quadrifasciata]|uniref:Acetylcholine receptor subunit alpha-like 1 n=1 Tax=Melipona quadrifasciata TaxID=166423 RepID=A0A0M8ZWT7_9HYME|nr:Acetylcholine receptor subunit alpha-like 1 [Melipona quadrifasciata]